MQKKYVDTWVISDEPTLWNKNKTLLQIDPLMYISFCIMYISAYKLVLMGYYLFLSKDKSCRREYIFKEKKKILSIIKDLDTDPIYAFNKERLDIGIKLVIEGKDEKDLKKILLYKYKKNAM